MIAKLNVNAPPSIAFQIQTAAGRYACIKVGMAGQDLVHWIGFTRNRPWFLNAALGNARSDGSFERLLACDQLSRRDCDLFIHAASVWMAAYACFPNRDRTNRWLSSSIPALNHQSPVDLVDTSFGREWVASVIQRIESDSVL